ncbi:MAG: molybdopterin-binding protein [Eubacteriales bacterium]|nr:molybdopterin-binding protein [Eubacteriales bacterium]
MKLINTKDAVGQVLCHDITQIIRGEKKGPVFKKGHIVREEDVPVLLSVGKEHLYVWEKEEGMLHENEAAEILCAICRGTGAEALESHMRASEPSEGKIELAAECSGLFKINRTALRAVNSFGQMMIASRHGDTAVKEGDKLLGTRIIPLVIEADKMEEVQRRAMKETDGKPVFSLIPFQKKKYAVVTTGSEVYKGLIKDTFTPVLIDKLAEYEAEYLGNTVCDDDPGMVTGAILDFLEKGAELVLCTGGMSVDPDDRTPLAIKNTGARIVSYGAPVLPGAMFLLAYMKGGQAVLGLPGCAMYAKRTIFDLVLPHIMADQEITAEMLSSLGEGGLCLNCSVCTYPNCGFGKGHCSKL